MLKNELGLLAQWVSGQVAEPLLRKECQRIRDAWTKVLFGAKDEVIRRYVRYQQQVLLGIADHLYTLHNPELLNGVLELHDYLVRYFKIYLDPSGKIPDALIPGLRKRIRTAAALLPLAAEPLLRSCLQNYVSQTAGAVKLTYCQQDYFFAFCDALKKAGNDQQRLVEILCTMNFNHSGFCRWYQQHLEQQGKGLAFFKRLLITVRSMPLAAGMAYDPALPTVSVQIADWLTAIIQQETEAMPKLGLKITVAQLALLIRLLSEEGFFATEHIAEILRFFCAHFTTKKQEHISYGSMNKLYYSADQFTAYAVRAILQKMVGRTNRMFFPS